ncbi:SAM-dependent methyltransferase [Kribbella sandramycini]|uniref:SAM-dependent methyltransferase n=1 Tax=Kribbella sandramycini TaxID=60450 RepID=A0A7Y4KYB3_9ACTN|nr:SAM-dependent methyltransferase [Kribbella sandramycini]MBB6569276.1 SAM-dependent methyltransferase [Kribbella sandramycini]NOL40885.1 SAM-dependent methyltransferase [Kribbella sandramycini]
MSEQNDEAATSIADRLNLGVPHSARVYDYFLGGKTNFAPDRAVAEKLLEAFPGFRTAAQSNRMWMHRAARYVAEQGVTQFLDIGTGIPTSPNLHEVVQQVLPAAHVVYVDNDPIVLAHSRALLVSTESGETAYIEADITDPQAILDSEEVRTVLDLSKPVALSIVGVFHYLPDDAKPYELLQQLVDALAPGSYLIFSHCTPDFAPEMWEQAIQVYKADGGDAQVRSRAEIERFFAGLELVDPGVEVPYRWHPDDETQALVDNETFTDVSCSLWVGVAKKP